MQRRLETLVKEHRDICKKGDLEICDRGPSVVSATPSRLEWDKGAGRGYQAYPAEGKGGIIERIPANTRLNCDGDYELLCCWIVTMKKLRGGANCTSTNHVGVSASTSAPICMGAQVHETRL